LPFFCQRYFKNHSILTDPNKRSLHFCCRITYMSGLALAVAQYCPESYGVRTYPREKYCDKFYLVSLLVCEAQQ
jgi:hypothetical protein